MTTYLHPQPAERKVCPTCRALMFDVGRGVWVCPQQSTELKIVSNAARATVKAVAEQRVAGLPF